MPQFTKLRIKKETKDSGQVVYSVYGNSIETNKPNLIGSYRDSQSARNIFKKYYKINKLNPSSLDFSKKSNQNTLGVAEKIKDKDDYQMNRYLYENYLLEEDDDYLDEITWPKEVKHDWEDEDEDEWEPHPDDMGIAHQKEIEARKRKKSTFDSMKHFSNMRRARGLKGWDDKLKKESYYDFDDDLNEISDIGQSRCNLDAEDEREKFPGQYHPDDPDHPDADYYAERKNL